MEDDAPLDRGEAVDGGEARVAERAHRPAPCAVEAVEAVHREVRGEVVPLAPSLVAKEGRPSARVASARRRLRRRLGQRRGIEDPEVDALPRERVDGVGGVAGEGDARGRAGRGPDRPEREAGPRPGPLDGPEPALEGGLERAPERVVREGEEMLRVFPFRRPGDRAETLRQRRNASGPAGRAACQAVSR